MVVASTEGIEVVQAVKSNGVFRGIVTESCSVAGDVTATDVVGGLGTNQETVTAEDCISGESGSLFTAKKSQETIREVVSIACTLSTSSVARV
jgi:hypothetical protein